jgi:hypothetical protein
MADILKHGTIKVLSVVDSDLLWHSIATDYVLPEEFLVGGGGYVGSRPRFNPLGEVLHYDYSKSVISLG